jgi:hypothetical protein
MLSGCSTNFLKHEIDISGLLSDSSWRYEGSYRDGDRGLIETLEFQVGGVFKETSWAGASCSPNADGVLW